MDPLLRCFALSRRHLVGGAIALAATPAAARAAPAPLRVMSFNVRLPIDKEPHKAWEARLPVAVAMIRRTRPLVIGTQELFRHQGDDLVAALPGHSWFGIDRRGGHADEHMGVIYDRRALRLIASGDFWLSDMPDVPGSISWGHPLPRMVTWGVFERHADRRRFAFLDTHLPYRGEDEAARVKGAEAIVRFVARDPRVRELPLVLTGDFNTTPDSQVHARLAAAMTDARSAPDTTGPQGTFHGFTGTPDKRIDWIFARGLKPRRFETLTDHDGAVYASDHFAVLADLAF